MYEGLKNAGIVFCNMMKWEKHWKYACQMLINLENNFNPLHRVKGAGNFLNKFNFYLLKYFDCFLSAAQLLHNLIKRVCHVLFIFSFLQVITPFCEFVFFSRCRQP